MGQFAKRCARITSADDRCRPLAAAGPVADLPIAELIEQQRRSVAVLAPGSPASNRELALELLEQLLEALRESAAAERQLAPHGRKTRVEAVGAGPSETRAANREVTLAHPALVSRA